MSVKNYYAHTRPDNPDPAHRQTLEDHLYGVAERAAVFAEAFGAGEWGYHAGLWHDLGKYSKGGVAIKRY